jgi:CBS domain-containing protein
MRTVRELLREKGREVVTILPEATVLDAIKLMADRNIGGLVVMENDMICGIFTERDYARNVALKGKSSPTTRVRDVMTSQVLCVGPEYTVEQCMTMMTEKRVRHLPVLEHKELVGIVSIGDLVKSIIADQRYTIEQLEQYIHG